MPFLAKEREELEELGQAVILFAAAGNHRLAKNFAQMYVKISEHTFPSDRGVQHRKDPFFLERFSSLTDDEFRSACRTSRASFVALVEYLEGNAVFSNDSGKPQVHPAWQIAVALAQFGGATNGTSAMSEMVLSGIDAGVISLYTNRVMEALMSVKEQWLAWPDEERREEMGQNMRSEGFPGCVGFVDFTSIPLARKPGPGIDGEPYFGAKSRYSIGMTIICDEDERIIEFDADHPGMWSSCYMFSQMDVRNHPERYFSPGEYLLADMAYTVTTHCIPAYKPRHSKTPDNKDFNTCVAKSNVRSENCIGVLKSRWGSLRSMTLQIQDEEDLKTFKKWVTSCCMLYNMLPQLGDQWDDVCLDDENPGYTGESVLGAKAARIFRETLKKTTLETNRRKGVV